MDTGRSCQVPLEEPPKQKRLTASRKQIFLSSSTFFRSFSCNSFSFFLSSRIFSRFCSSLTSESWEPGGLEVGAGKVYPRDVSFLFKGQRIFKPNLLLNSLFLFSLFVNIIKGNGRTFSHAPGHPAEPGNEMCLLRFGSVIFGAVIKCLMP